LTFIKQLLRRLEMAGSVYALLVGIDAYPDSTHRLAGCRNDVQGFGEWLQWRLALGQLHLQTLLDEAATRDRVIAAFRQHLGRAGAQDTVLFYFAGHGSRERAPQAFWAIEPDRMDETLVLWDSRAPGGHDLADKEIAALLRELAVAGPQIVVILDACHSGSGTRAAPGLRRQRVRRFPNDLRERPLDTFLPAVQALLSSSPGDSGWSFGDDAPHVLLAACADDEEAAEYDADARTHGAFTYFLLQTLREAPGPLSVRDLANAARARVVVALGTQTPQIEATDATDLDREFLGGLLPARTDAFTASCIDGQWWMDGGRIHGLPPSASTEPPQVALFAAHADALAMSDPAAALARAEVVEVEAGRSRLQLMQGTPPPDASCKAVLVSAPLPAWWLHLSGEPAALAQARQALSTQAVLPEAAEGSTADYELACTAGSFRLLRPSDGSTLVAPIATADQALRQLAHIVRWRQFAELDNPLTAIDPQEIEFSLIEVRRGAEVVAGNDVRLSARSGPKGLIAPEFRLRFANRGQRTLYFALLALDETYACSTSLIAAGVQKLEPGDEPGWALDRKALKSSVPQALRNEGRHESRDLLKLIVSTTPFDIRHAELASLGGGQRSLVPGTITSTLDRLLARRQSRTISAASNTDQISDFCTRTIVVTTFEPPAGVALGLGAADLGAGVRIGAHPALQAQAQLTTLEQSRSDLGTHLLPPLFRTEDGGETVQFSGRRGAARALDVLELTDVSHRDAVTASAPLRIHLATGFDDGDLVLPIAYDGEDYLVLGHGQAQGGQLVVSLQRLPHPVALQKRSLTGSIRILFQKFKAAVFGAPYDYPLLASAHWPGDQPVRYDTDMDHVRARVATATRVIVFVHGIIGDTLAMGAHLQPRAGDVLLAFDYENLHTTIENNALGLQQRIAQCGLAAGHGKQVVLVAHSLGGLVSRWYIEKLDGNQVVTQLVLCGTPNAGSNWATIEDFVTGAASLALNSLTVLAWPVAAIAGLFAGLEKIDNTMDQMSPQSALIQALARSPDPGLPYAVLVGNTSLASAADGPRIERLLKKVLHRTASVAFLFAPNDIAVSVQSIGAVGREWAHAPELREVACDHLSYFASDVGLSELRRLLGL
jgi:uncharacterized caspase-like protein